MNGLAPQQNHATRPRELALFAGVGGGILAGKLLNWRTVCAVEIDEYCRRVLMQRQDDGILDPFPIYDDITTFDGRPWRGYVDIVSGGFPCQDISAAGDGDGLDGARSGLWSHMARVIGEVGPTIVVVENSPLLTKRGLGRVLGGLAGLGYDGRWGMLGANNAGYGHRRKRIWIVANLPGYRLERWDDGGTEGQWQAAQRSVAGLCEAPPRIDLPAPDAFGAANGIPSRVDRLKSIGNAQVPRVAALAYRLLSPR